MNTLIRDILWKFFSAQRAEFSHVSDRAGIFIDRHLDASHSTGVGGLGVDPF